MKVYRSKIGVGLSIILMLSYAMTICAILFGENKEWWIFSLITLLYGFIFYTFLNTKYVVNADFLVIKLGFITMKTIQISSIVKIEESRSILSSPASSMHRWEIIYNKYDSILISPKDAAEFIDEMKQLNPLIQVVYRKQG